MVYVQPQSANRKTSTLIAVGAVHAIGLYAIAAALGVAVIPRAHEHRPVGIPLPVPKPPKPAPEPTPEPQHTAAPDPFRTKPVENDRPRPVGDDPAQPFDFGGETGTVGDTGGTGAGSEERIEPVPPAPPSPRFAPKGPQPRGNLGRWVTPEDYPTRALNLGQEGVTRVRLTVSAGGRITGCDVTTSSGSPLLDSVTCSKLFSRGSFEAATDGDGAAIAGSFSTSVRWQLPD